MAANWTRQFTPSDSFPIIWTGQVGDKIYDDSPAKWFRATRSGISVDPTGFSVVTSAGVNVHLSLSAMDARLGGIPAAPAVSGTYHLVVTSGGVASWVSA